MKFGMRWKTWAAIAMVAVSAPALSEPLWQTFEIGSSKEQVLKALPGAVLDQANSTDRISEYRVDDYPDTDMWTYVTFDGGLQKVRIFGRGAANYLLVKEKLQKKYGKPSSTSTAASSSLTIWQRATVTIAAKLEPSRDMGAGFVAHEPFSVTYSPTIESTLDQGL